MSKFIKFKGDNLEITGIFEKLKINIEKIFIWSEFLEYLHVKILLISILYIQIFLKLKNIKTKNKKITFN